VNSKEETVETFVPVMSKNSASGHVSFKHKDRSIEIQDWTSSAFRLWGELTSAELMSPRS
jgi:hypothetical protein